MAFSTQAFPEKKEIASFEVKFMKNTKPFLFQVHVSESTAIADHCSTYALSDITDVQLQTPCQHVHDRSCSQCEDLQRVLWNIEGYLLSEARMP